MKKISTLQTILTIVFVTSLLVSNIITARQIEIFGLALTGGILVFPITYILSDIFSEVYGYKWSRLTCYVGFVMNLLTSIIFLIVINSPYPEYFTSAEAYQIVLGNTPRILFASLLALLVGDFINDRVFKKLKAKHKHDHKGFGLRAIFSSFCGQLGDSLIFYPIAFLGTMPLMVIVEMGLFEITVKIVYEIIILPLTKIIVKKVSRHERGLICTSSLDC